MCVQLVGDLARTYEAIAVLEQVLEEGCEVVQQDRLVRVQNTLRCLSLVFEDVMKQEGQERGALSSTPQGRGCERLFGFGGRRAAARERSGDGGEGQGGEGDQRRDGAGTQHRFRLQRGLQIEPARPDRDGGYVVARLRVQQEASGEVPEVRQAPLDDVDHVAERVQEFDLGGAV